MKGDFHVRFCENAGVKLPCVTRLAFVAVLDGNGRLNRECSSQIFSLLDAGQS